jgi:hypothetical protein
MTGPLPQTIQGNNRIIVIVDHFTKFVQLYPIKTLEASEEAMCLMNTFYRFGLPNQILSDRGTNFQAIVIHKLCDLLDIRQTKTTAYHPQTDGISERFMRTIKPMIKVHLTNKKQDDWDMNLNALAFAYNTARHNATKQPVLSHVYETTQSSSRFVRQLSTTAKFQLGSGRICKAHTRPTSVGIQISAGTHTMQNGQSKNKV